MKKKSAERWSTNTASFERVPSREWGSRSLELLCSVGPERPPRRKREHEHEDGASRDHLQRDPAPSIRDVGSCEHDRVEDGGGEHERQARGGVDPARNETTRHRDGSAVAHGKREAPEHRQRHLQAQTFAGHAHHHALGNEHLEHRAGHRPDEDERNGFDHDRGEDQDEVLRGRDASDVDDSGRHDDSRDSRAGVGETARAQLSACVMGEDRSRHSSCSR
jgi:hypothetical protein